MSTNRLVFGLIQDHKIVIALGLDKTNPRWCWKTSSNVRRDKSFVYDLNIRPSVVRTRVDFVPRFAETQLVSFDLHHFSSSSLSLSLSSSFISYKGLSTYDLTWPKNRSSLDPLLSLSSPSLSTSASHSLPLSPSLSVSPSLLSLILTTYDQTDYLNVLPTLLASDLCLSHCGSLPFINLHLPIWGSLPAPWQPSSESIRMLLHKRIKLCVTW